MTVVRGHHNVHRRTDGDHVEVDVRTLHAVAACLGADEVALAHLGTHGGEALDMLVDGTHAAEVAAAGHGDFRTAETAEQCADQIIRCTDFFNIFIINTDICNCRSVDLDCRSVDSVNLSPYPGNCF